MTEFFKNRAPLDAQKLAQELSIRHCLWQNATIKDEVTSTNDIAKDLIKNKDKEGTFVIANFQTQGRGRQNRTWEAPKNSSIFISIILKPRSANNIGWIPLITGLSLHKTIAAESRKSISIKWPNDLLVNEHGSDYKYAGILAEKVDEFVVVGVGINYDQDIKELPIEKASSLKHILQNDVSKEAIIASFLTELSARWEEENNAEVFPTPSIVREYKTECKTINSEISAQVPGGEVVEGSAIDISQTGELVVQTSSGIKNISSADIHLRS